MADQPESLEADEIEADGPASRGVADAPLIVIEYRQHGLTARLLPPALILLTALGISSYQRTTPVRPIAPKQTAVLPSTESTGKLNVEVVTRVTEPKAAPKPSIPPVEEAPKPAPRVASLFDLDPVPGLDPLPPTPRDPKDKPALVETARVVEKPGNEPPRVAQAMDPPKAQREDPPAAAVEEVSREDILRDIERESQAKQAQRANLERIKPRAEAMLTAEAVGRVADQREPFRQDLRQLLGQLGNRAGDEIDKLCEQYYREPIPATQEAFRRALRSTSGRMSREGTVQMMRSVGIPEPVILDYLAHQLHKTINMRGGPRDENEVRVRAARALLAIPLTATAARPASAQPDARPAVARPR